MIVLLNYTYELILILATIIGIANWKKKGIIAKFLTLILLATTLVEVITYFLSRENKNIQLYHHIYTPIEGILFASIALQVLQKFKWRYFYLICVIWIGIAFTNACFFESTENMNYNTILLESFFCSMLSSLMLYQMIVNREIIHRENPSFWIASSFLIFNCVTFFYLGFFETIYKEHNGAMGVLTTTHLIVNLLFYASQLYVLLVLPAKRWIYDS